MFDLRWSWLCVPYIVCTAALAAMGVVAGLVRGDRVMRLGVIGVATAALPWAICSGLAICTDDALVAGRLLRLGTGPVSLIGPNLLLVLLGISGQLERHRWAIWLSGLVGAVLLGLCWGTGWTVPGVHRLTSGVFYVTGGPLTDIHLAQLAMWIAVGLVIARRSMMSGERRTMLRVLVAASVLAAIGATDVLLVHGVVGVYPIAWLPATIACAITLYLELRTDLLRPRGFNGGALIELLGFVAAAVLVGALAYLLHGAAAVAIAAIASAAWITVTAIVWWLGRRRPPPRVFAERALERFIAGLTDIDDDRRIGDGLAALWRGSAIEVRATWRAELGGLVDVATGAICEIDRDVTAWLVGHAQPLAAADLATMRLGPIRPRVEAWAASRAATLFVPLVDRGTLVGLVEAEHVAALREAERGLVAQSARAAARALSYVNLSRIAAREASTAREVEVAEAMRRQASARHDDELGPWLVTAEYRSAARTTGAAWSANLAGGNRLALLVTEGQAHGVPAALATAALTGAFVAATTTSETIRGGDPAVLAGGAGGNAPRGVGERSEAIGGGDPAGLAGGAEGNVSREIAERSETMGGGDPAGSVAGAGGKATRGITELVAALRASAEDVLHGGEPIAAFIAILDLDARTIAWGCAGHPGALIIAPGTGGELVPLALGGNGGRLGDVRGETERGSAPLAPDHVLVVASSGVHGGAAAWRDVMRDPSAVGARLAARLVDAAAAGGQPAEDLLAVVVRQRGEHRSGRVSDQGEP